MEPITFKLSPELVCSWVFEFCKWWVIFHGWKSYFTYNSYCCFCAYFHNYFVPIYKHFGLVRFWFTSFFVKLEHVHFWSFHIRFFVCCSHMVCRFISRVCIWLCISLFISWCTITLIQLFIVTATNQISYFPTAIAFFLMQILFRFVVFLTTIACDTPWLSTFFVLPNTPISVPHVLFPITRKISIPYIRDIYGSRLYFLSYSKGLLES